MRPNNLAVGTSLLAEPAGRITRLGRSFARSRDYDAMGEPGSCVRTASTTGRTMPMQFAPLKRPVM
jgi:hypothetical protein